MDSSAVTKEKIIEAVASLSPEQLSELSRFIEFLHFKSEKRPQRFIRLGGLRKDFAPEPPESVLQSTFGMWQDRTDVPRDGVDYVREMRRGRRLDEVRERPDEAD